jgi:hypothetical protein
MSSMLVLLEWFFARAFCDGFLAFTFIFWVLCSWIVFVVFWLLKFVASLLLIYA